MTQGRSTFARALRHFRGYRRALAGLAGLSLLGALLEATSYALIVPLASVAFAGGEEFRLPFAGMERTVPIGVLFGLAVGSVLANAVVVLLLEFATALVTGRYSATQQRRAFRALLDARWSVQTQEQEGRLQDLLSTHLNRAQMGLRNLVTGLRALVAFVIFLAGAVALGGVAVLLVIGLLGLLFVAMRPLATRTRKNSAALAQESPRYSNLLAQALRMAREIRLFRAADAVYARADAIVERFRTGTIRQRMLGAAAPTLYQAAGLLVLLGGIALLPIVAHGPAEPLAVTAILTLKALQYGRGFQQEYHVCNDLLPFAEELEGRLAGLEAAKEHDAGQAVPRVGEIRLEDVGFGYDADRPVLAGIGFTLGAGDSLGVIGPSGAGKTTLLQLLLRLRDPERGRILVDGEPIDRIAKACWRERVAFVPQEAQLFSDTVLENIRAYRPEVSRADAIDAARQAGIDAEIEAMPGGYDADAGERGGRLSGGQRQRICIARALAGRPDVVLFDEPTSALDAHSEAAVQETLLRLRGRTTLLVVAHRLTTLAACDKILVLKDGGMAGFGRRDEMMREAGYFNEVLRLSNLR